MLYFEKGEISTGFYLGGDQMRVSCDVSVRLAAPSYDV